MKIGYAGLGLMGAPMAANLLEAGHEVMVWNRNPAAAEPLAAAGAAVAEVPADLGRSCELIITCLPNGAVVNEVLFGRLGALREAAHGTAVVDHSTILQADALQVHQACALRGIEFIDAPVSGGPEGAARGTLAVFAGGDEATIERLRPVLDVYAKVLVRLGGPGSGQVGKLANQMIIATTVLGIAEALAYTQAEGLDPARLVEVLQAATADSAMLRTRAPIVGLQPGMPASNGWKPGFTADFMAKDLGFAIKGAHKAGVPVAGAEMVAGLLEQLQARGQGGDDWTAISALVRPSN